MFRADTPRRDGGVATTKTYQGLRLARPGHQPENASGAIKHGIGERQAAEALIGAGHRDLQPHLIKYGISRNERRRVAIVPEPQMDQIEHRWDPGELPQGG